MNNESVTAVYEKTTPGSPPNEGRSETNFPIKLAIGVLIVFTIALGLGAYWIVSNRESGTSVPSNQLSTQPSPTPLPVAIEEYNPQDYTEVFTITVPEGYATLKGYESESHGRSIVALKAPDDAQLTDPIIRFNLADKDPSVTLEKFAYDPDLCDPESELGKNCGGRYNPPYVNREIEVDGKKGLWQQVNSLPSGDRLLVYIEKSDSQVVIISSFTHVDATAYSKLDQRIIPIFEGILESFQFVKDDDDTSD